VKRRDLMLLVAGAMTAARGLHAQQKRMPVIGFLCSGASGAFASAAAAFRQGLSETGYVEGQNVVIEYRWAEGRYDRLPVLAADLVARKVDIIAAIGGTPPALAAKNATATIPIVFGVGDAVELGVVASLARPGGNLTGVSLLGSELTPKRIEIISELVPRAKVIALLVNPNNEAARQTMQKGQEAARAKQVQLHILQASSEGEIDTAFATLVELHAGALLVGGDPLFDTRADLLVALAARHAVPAIYPAREFVAAGGLISYGASRTSGWHQEGTYVGKILSGAMPADLPVQQPTRYELVINVNTAKALGLMIPQTVLLRADEVIE